MPKPVPLVFIPALLCDEAMFHEVIADLGALVSAQVSIAASPTVAASVAHILARAPDRFVLAGASYGGIIAMEIALAAPERIVGLWVTGSDPGAPDREASLGFAGMIEAQTEAAIDHLAGLVVHSRSTAGAATFRAMAARLGGRTGGAQMRALAERRSAWERLGELTMPTLVLWGAEDALVPVAVGRKLADALVGARFTEVAGSGHLPTLEQPGQAATIVREWLSRTIVPD